MCIGPSFAMLFIIHQSREHRYTLYLFQLSLCKVIAHGFDGSFACEDTREIALVPAVTADALPVIDWIGNTFNIGRVSFCMKIRSDEALLFFRYSKEQEFHSSMISKHMRCGAGHARQG